MSERKENMATIEERVSRGAAFLSEVAPGWEGRVNLGDLKLSSGMQCICGQVFDEVRAEDENGYGYFERTLASEGIAWLDAKGIDSFYAGAALGFDVEVYYNDSYRDLVQQWRELETAWTAEIKGRFDRGEIS
jgi:hypothetical protein